MAILKCKICGGDMEVSPDKSFGTCEYCGSSMTLPKVSDEQRAALFNRGNHFRRSGEFDKALAIYENVVREDDTDAEAHWCCALCRFGIEYVEDPATLEYVPTCHRASFDSFLKDVDYLAALENSEGITRRQYQKDAAKIADVQKGILATSQNEEPFDVFICYKETDDTTKQRTKDSIDAQEIYYQLTNEGYRVFFSRITLEDKTGAEYEPYIFAALNSAKVMVVIGSKPEYFNAVWVKNEWSRFLTMMRKDRSKLLLPCYKGMNPYDLPEQLSVLQSYDMAKIGFIQDLTRGIKKVVKKDEPKEIIKETVVVGTSNASVAPLLERAFLFLEDGKWQDANIYCEKVLDIDPKNAEAYLGKLMADLQVRSRKQLADCAEPFDDEENYGKVLRFGDDKLEAEMRGYIAHINERNENARLAGIYNGAVSAMNAANTESAYRAAAYTFRSISGFRDADSLVEQCLDKAEVCRKNAIYASAHNEQIKNCIAGCKAAIRLYESISGWKDADEQIYACRKKIEEIKAKEEADRLERERQAEQKRIAAEKAAKKRKKVIAIATPIVIACIAFLIVLTTVIISNGKYNSAVELYNTGKYDEAIAAFKELNGYKDSEAQITKCETAINDAKYNAAVELYNTGKYDEAIAAFKELNGYKDSEAQITKCETAINDAKYNAAVELYNAKKYEDAYKAFSSFNYKDSADKAAECLFLKQKAGLTNVTVGSTIKFGFYEQDNNTSNGKEEIEWKVLAVEGNKALVISQYALDCKPYDNTTDTTWEKCTLRTWLNGTFYNNAFGADHQKMIASSTVTADKNPSYSTSPGNNTTDKVFLLSITEVNKYFSSDVARECAPTDYAKAQGAYTSSIFSTGGKATCLWWLRSPGRNSYYAAVVKDYGSYASYSVDFGGVAVRPALWIDIGS